MLKFLLILLADAEQSGGAILMVFGVLNFFGSDLPGMIMSIDTVLLSAPMVAFWAVFGYAIARHGPPAVGGVLGAIEGALISIVLAYSMISLAVGIWLGALAFIYAVFMIRWLDQRRIF